MMPANTFSGMVDLRGRPDPRRLWVPIPDFQPQNRIELRPVVPLPTFQENVGKNSGPIRIDSIGKTNENSAGPFTKVDVESRDFFHTLVEQSLSMEDSVSQDAKKILVSLLQVNAELARPDLPFVITACARAGVADLFVERFVLGKINFKDQGKEIDDVRVASIDAARAVIFTASGRHSASKFLREWARKLGEISPHVAARSLMGAFILSTEICEVCWWRCWIQLLSGAALITGPSFRAIIELPDARRILSKNAAGASSLMVEWLSKHEHETALCFQYAGALEVAAMFCDWSSVQPFIYRAFENDDIVLRAAAVSAFGQVMNRGLDVKDFSEKPSGVRIMKLYDARKKRLAK